MRTRLFVPLALLLSTTLTLFAADSWPGFRGPGDGHATGKNVPTVWNETGELVGGGYGVALGRTFFTESQFSREPNTSKIGFTVLNWHLAKWGFRLNDGKWPTPTILDMGFRSIPRAAFLTELASTSATPGKERVWELETDLKTISNWQPGEVRTKKSGKDVAAEPMGF